MAKSKELRKKIAHKLPSNLPVKWQKNKKQNSTGDKQIFDAFHQKMQIPFKNNNRNNYIHRYASVCNRYGIPKHETETELLKFQQPGFGDSEIRRCINNAYKREHQFGIRNINDQSIPSKQNMRNSINTYDSIESELNKAELDYNNPPSAPQVALRIDGQIVATLGNFIAIIGKAKSRKTFALTAAIAAALGQETLNMKGELPHGKKKVLHFDTEQSNYHVYKTYERIVRQAGERKNLRVFQLRNKSTENRLKLIEYAIQNTPNLGLIVIDGIRDLLTDINSPDQATMIVDRLMTWTHDYEISIIVVLHQNKNDQNARGHLGSEIVNKAESTINISKSSSNREVSLVKTEFGRNIEFPPFAFRINENGLPELCEIEGSPTRRIDPDDYAAMDHKNAVCEIFSRHTELNSTEMDKAICDLSATYYDSFGNSKARLFRDYYVNEGYIIQKQKGKAKLYQRAHDADQNDPNLKLPEAENHEKRNNVIDDQAA